jgi:hypothetical protein
VENLNLAAWAVIAKPTMLASGKTSYDGIVEEELPLEIFSKGGNVIIAATKSVVGRLEQGRVLGRINCGSRFAKSYKSQEEALKDPAYCRHLKAQSDLAEAVVKEIGNDRLLAIAICSLPKISGSKAQVYDPNLQVSSLSGARDYIERLRELHGLPTPVAVTAPVTEHATEHATEPVKGTVTM